ncbi:hypothetical protein [Planotetraspora sp. GP83]|uniref:hypothetical protein n=1 Tax=Planotetraspora sp. GP83 TaxID=3156264 RepID=UPI003514698E
MITNRIAITLSVASLFVGAIVGVLVMQLLHRDPAFLVTYADPRHAFDVGDDRVLAGWADNVFTGKVVAKAGQEAISTSSKFPITLWSVEVTSNIKGNLTGAITVVQQGGYLEDANTLTLMEGDALLAPDHEYLFVSRGRQGRHWVVPAYGDIPFMDGSVEGNASLRDRWQTAVKNQLPDAWKKHLEYTPNRD